MRSGQLAVVFALLAAPLPVWAASESKSGESSSAPDARATEVLSFACDASRLAITSGETGTTRCSVATPREGSRHPVRFACDAPPGIACRFAPSRRRASGSTVVESVLEIGVAEDTPPGNYALRAGAQTRSGSGVAEITIVVPVPVPSFSVACAPAQLSIVIDKSAAATCTVTSTHGFHGPVTLSCPSPPQGVSCGFSPNVVTPLPNGSNTSTLTISAASPAVAGATAVTVRGTGSGMTRNFAVNLTLINPVVYSESFETDTGGWVRNPAGTDTATTGLWERGDPEQTSSGSIVLQSGSAFNGSQQLVTGLLAGASAGVNDVDGGTTSIRSPEIALPPAVALTLKITYSFAYLLNATSADFLRVSILSGANKTILIQAQGAPSNVAAAYNSVTLNLSPFSGKTVRILIEAADAGTASLIEAAVDGITILAQ